MIIIGNEHERSSWDSGKNGFLNQDVSFVSILASCTVMILLVVVFFPHFIPQGKFYLKNTNKKTISDNSIGISKTDLNTAQKR